MKMPEAVKKFIAFYPPVIGEWRKENTPRLMMVVFLTLLAVAGKLLYSFRHTDTFKSDVFEILRMDPGLKFYVDLRRIYNGHSIILPSEKIINIPLCNRINKTIKIEIKPYNYIIGRERKPEVLKLVADRTQYYSAAQHPLGELSLGRQNDVYLCPPESVKEVIYFLSSDNDYYFLPERYFFSIRDAKDKE
jgi:hypothetical protein